jgi:hypothetical protein
MTTTITIKHEGPDHHDVLVSAINPNNGNTNGSPVRLRMGEETTIALWDTQCISILETAKQAPAVAVVTPSEPESDSGTQLDLPWD